VSYLEKHSDKVDTFIGVCHHLAAHQYVTGHGGNLAWKLEDNVILITPISWPRKKLIKQQLPNLLWLWLHNMQSPAFRIPA